MHMPKIVQEKQSETTSQREKSREGIEPILDDGRPAATAQRQRQILANNSPQVHQLRSLQAVTDKRPQNILQKQNMNAVWRTKSATQLAKKEKLIFGQSLYDFLLYVLQDHFGMRVSGQKKTSTGGKTKAGPSASDRLAILTRDIIPYKQMASGLAHDSSLSTFIYQFVTRYKSRTVAAKALATNTKFNQALRAINSNRMASNLANKQMSRSNSKLAGFNFKELLTPKLRLLIGQLSSTEQQTFEGLVAQQALNLIKVLGQSLKGSDLSGGPHLKGELTFSNPVIRNRLKQIGPKLIEGLLAQFRQGQTLDWRKVIPVQTLAKLGARTEQQGAASHGLVVKPSTQEIEEKIRAQNGNPLKK